MNWIAVLNKHFLTMPYGTNNSVRTIFGKNSLTLGFVQKIERNSYRLYDRNGDASSIPEYFDLKTIIKILKSRLEAK